MHQHSTSAILEEAIVALVRRKGLAYVERQYDSGLLSPAIEPAFEQWKQKQTRQQATHRVPIAALATVAMLVAYFAVVWSV